MLSGQLDTHVERLRGIYATKCEAISTSLEEHASNWLQFQRPEGGFFLWGECLGMSSEALSQKATEVGVMFPTGANFFIDRTADTSACPHRLQSGDAPAAARDWPPPAHRIHTVATMFVVGALALSAMLARGSVTKR